MFCHSLGYRGETYQESIQKRMMRLPDRKHSVAHTARIEETHTPISLGYHVHSRVSHTWRPVDLLIHYICSKGLVFSACPGMKVLNPNG